MTTAYEGTCVQGFSYELDYYFKNEKHATIAVGTKNEFSKYLDMIMNEGSKADPSEKKLEAYEITSRMLGMEKMPSKISIYPLNINEDKFFTRPSSRYINNVRSSESICSHPNFMVHIILLTIFIFYDKKPKKMD